MGRKWRAMYLNNISAESLPVEVDARMLLGFFLSKRMETSLFFILAIFGFSNHVYSDQFAFEKTQYGCQLLKTLISDLTANHTKSITDEQELIRQTLALLNDTKT